MVLPGIEPRKKALLLKHAWKSIIFTTFFEINQNSCTDVLEKQRPIKVV